jgi:hypothetical protein
MIIEFDKSFSKSLDKINDKPLLKKLTKVFEIIEKSNSLSKL